MKNVVKNVKNFHSTTELNRVHHSPKWLSEVKEQAKEKEKKPATLAEKAEAKQVKQKDERCIIS